MSDKTFVSKLDEWARNEGLSYSVVYSEVENNYEVKIISASPKECVYIKRTYDFEQFIEVWKRNLPIK